MHFILSDGLSVSREEDDPRFPSNGWLFCYLLWYGRDTMPLCLPPLSPSSPSSTNDSNVEKLLKEVVPCKGKKHCPLGISHAPNGQEHCMGCSICAEKLTRDPELLKAMKKNQAEFDKVMERKRLENERKERRAQFINMLKPFLVLFIYGPSPPTYQHERRCTHK